MPLCLQNMLHIVICRIGSLETMFQRPAIGLSVICRIGSLERYFDGSPEDAMVICRIGSLERIPLTTLL